MSTPEPPRAADEADAPTAAALVTLIEGTHLATPDRLPDAVAAAGRHLGLDVVLYLVTFDQRLLVPLLPAGAAETPALDVSGEGAGRAFRLVTSAEDDGTLWLPLLDGVERLGVLRFRAVGDRPSPYLRPDRLRSFVYLAGHLVAIVTPYGDTITRTRGGQARTVEAELLWNLLPPLTYATRDITVSGLVVPCEQVAGDVFDYAAEGSTAQVALFDGTGHNLTSGLLSSVALATYRNHRRRGASLAECARAIDQVLLAHTDGTGYATGVLLELDTDSGRLRYVNAGHPRPVLLRAGRFTTALDVLGRPLFGLGDAEVTLGEVELQRGDRVVLYTDGMIEARAADGTFFGLDRLVSIIEECSAVGTPAPEMLRLAVEKVLEHQHDVLQDDATVVVLEWGTGSPGQLNPE